MLVRGRCEDAFKATFGDHEHPGYADALQAHYDNGPPPGWESSYISRYATMHPWEDFAESFATYLDMVSVLDTSHNLRVARSVDPRHASCAGMLDRYMDLGVVLNEMSRAMGLIDLVPEVFSPAIVTKIEFVHQLVREAVSACSPPLGSASGDPRPPMLEANQCTPPVRQVTVSSDVTAADCAAPCWRPVSPRSC